MNFNNFKHKLKEWNSKNKSSLMNLYAKTYFFEDMSFSFESTGRRTIEKPYLIIDIPLRLFEIEIPESPVVFEDYVLRTLCPQINEYSRSLENPEKDPRAKAEIEGQVCNQLILRRNGAVCVCKDEISHTEDKIQLKFMFRFSLANASYINSKANIKFFTEIFGIIRSYINDFDKARYEQFTDVYSKQMQIRAYMRKNSIIAFIANGSMLPRENGTQNMMKSAIPFKSPESLAHTITFNDGTEITGMAIKKGITVITGGGYSGKSTVLDAIETGIYNHIPDDGREFVITDSSALKIYAEDGRPVSNINMSPFFRYLPNNIDIDHFSTRHASGSISQAANIIEAVCAQSKLLLIDEDRSATNFMIRDKNMRKIVKREPIIPFTDRVRELYFQKDVSTVLVIGGSSEYFLHADTIILMDDYNALDITESTRADLNINIQEHSNNESIAWMDHRFMQPIKTQFTFVFFRSVNTENAKMIVLDDYSSNITMLTSLVSDYQLNSIAYIMETLMTNPSVNETELLTLSQEISDKMFINKNEEDIVNLMLSNRFKISRWFEEVRPIDIFCTASRMRGLELS